MELTRAEASLPAEVIVPASIPVICSSLTLHRAPLLYTYYGTQSILSSDLQAPLLDLPQRPVLHKGSLLAPSRPRIHRNGTSDNPPHENPNLPYMHAKRAEALPESAGALLLH